ncbi:MAG: DUF3089 domain-containing protein [Solirubrobacteraceae bacterium]
MGVAAAVVGGLVTAGPAAAKTVWLCQPGHHPDPCTPGLSTTAFSPRLKRLRVIHPQAARHPPIDCFYVYPTVSDQKGPNANLQIDPEERSIALYQAARYSQECRVFAPMYRQITIPALDSGNPEGPAQLQLGLSDVRRAFQTYLRKYNHGHGFVLIGHSQGSLVLRELIAQEIDPKPLVRAQLVSAILLGGNVLVRSGRGIGGDFQHIPACRTAVSIGCVVAYSTFDQPPPTNSLFGRTSIPGDQVLCVNPAALVGAKTVDPIEPSQPFAPGTLLALGIKLLNFIQPRPPTVWSSLPGAYSASCSAAGGANVLQIRSRGGAQVATPSPSPIWGLHLVDANIELGNLVTLVHRQAAAFAQLTLTPKP